MNEYLEEITITVFAVSLGLGQTGFRRFFLCVHNEGVSEAPFGDGIEKSYWGGWLVVAATQGRGLLVWFSFLVDICLHSMSIRKAEWRIYDKPTS